MLVSVFGIPQFDSFFYKSIISKQCLTRSIVMKVLLVCTLSVHLAFSSTLPILENHGTIHSLAQRSKELHVSVDADAYMNDVSPLYWVVPLPNLIL